MRTIAYRSLPAYIRILIVFTLFDLIILLVRDLVLQDHTYDFLLWNLFLGGVALLFAIPLRYFYNRLNLFWVIVLAALWLLFYPNAPYMITDLIHVQSGESMVVYDTLIIFSFSMLSLYYGFYSLKLVEFVFTERFSKRVALVIVIGSIVLSSFGVYLGRILRLNSWDVFTHPFETLKLIVEHLIPVSKNPATYVIIILFSAIQFIMLRSMKELETVDPAR